MSRNAVARRILLPSWARCVLALPALAATLGVGALGSSNAWAQSTTLSGNVGTSTGPAVQQSIPNNPNASLSGVVSQDPIGNEAKANGTLAALDGRFTLSSHACSGGGPGFGGNANASATCTVTQDFQVVSTTLPAGTPVMIRIRWAVSGQGTAAGNLTHYISGAIGGVNGHVSITVGGVGIINRNGERRREYTTAGGYYHFIYGALNPEADSLTHNVTALVGQNIRIYMAGTASASTSATLSSVTAGDSQMAMLWGISSLSPNASVVSLTYPGDPPPPAANATLANAEMARPPRPPELPQCFTFSNQPSPTSACASTNAGFSVSAAGTGPFTYQWYRNGVLLDANANPSAATASLVLNGVTAGQAGSYTVKVTNPCGSRTTEGAVLTVTSPPTIATHPGSVSVSPSAMAPVSVTADGPVDYYQWQIETAPGVWSDLSSKSLDLPCGGTAVTDTDNSSTVQIAITPCPGVDQYQVRAVASNDCGSATSNEATITVVPAGGVPGNPAGATALLARPTPNPTHGSTTLAYTLSAPSPVRLEIFDAAGRLVTVLFDGEQTAGRYEPMWQGTDERGRAVMSGIYFARLTTFQNGKPAVSQRKINLLR